MEFFDKLGKKASETYKLTAEKTGKFAKETKMKLKINELKSNVSDLYEKIGKKVYERHEIGKKSVSFDKDLVEEISKLEELTKEIAKLNEQCLTLQNKKKCPNCDKEINISDKFCHNCGYKLYQTDIVNEQETLEEKEASRENDNEKKDKNNKAENRNIDGAKENKKLEKKEDENKKSEDKKHSENKKTDNKKK